MYGARLLLVILIAVSLLFAVCPSWAYASEGAGNEDNEGEGEDHLRDVSTSLSSRSVLPVSYFNISTKEDRRRGGVNDGESTSEHQLHDLKLDLGGRDSARSRGGGGGGERKQLQRRGDIFELEDAATSNSWSGPQTGTSGKNWECITSDALGVNLAAGTVGSGKLLLILKE